MKLKMAEIVVNYYPCQLIKSLSQKCYLCCFNCMESQNRFRIFGLFKPGNWLFLNIHSETLLSL